MTAAGPPARRGVFVAEIVALIAATAVDSVLAVRLGTGRRPLAGLVSPVTSVGTAVAVLAVLRRRFPRRIGRLGAAVVAFSLLSSAVTAWAGLRPPTEPVATEVVAAALLTGAGCRRLRPVQAVALAVAAGLAVVAAPVVRYGIESPMALLAVPAALLWGAALAIGLILRDADARHLAEVDQVRTNERLRMARELHDLVAHYITGIVVRVQAARSLAGNPDVPVQDPVEVYGEIEDAGAEALVAMRKLVGMLRSSEHALPLPSAGLGDIVRAAVPAQATVDIAEEVDALRVPPELSSTVHRVVLEAMTNTRRHAPDATEILVAVRLEDGDLVLDISNDMVPDTPPDQPSGYGIVGMTERVAALGGTLDAGPRPGNRWRITARLPLEPAETAAGRLPGGV
jgi:signal transduction histidine kinase